MSESGSELQVPTLATMATIKEGSESTVSGNIEKTILTRVQVDGGPQAWATLVGGFLVTMSTFGYTYSFGVYQDIYTISQLASETRISWIGSTQLFLIFFVGLPAGKMLDLGYYRHTMIAGTIIYVFSMFMVSLAHHDQYYQIFLSQAIGMGIGAGMLYVPAMAIQAHYWQKRRALAMGVAVLGISTGGIFFPIMLNELFKGSAGFVWGVRASAFLCLGLLSISVVLMKPNSDILTSEKPKPDIKSIITDVPYMTMNIGAGLVEIGLFFPIFYLQLFTALKGLDPNFAFYTLVIMNAATFPGRIIPNFFADRIGPFNACIPVGAMCAALILAMLHIESVGSVVVFAILYGFFSGAWLSLASPCVATLAKHPSELGVRFGISFAMSGIGALIGNPVDGTLLGNTFPWWRAIVFSAVTVLGGNVLILYTRHFIAKNKGTQFV
ncbi:MFS general substrate transporter [Cyathus striatus]|nr:MFS general substrate transporter [Cyathus striatus]